MPKIVQLRRKPAASASSEAAADLIQQALATLAAATELATAAQARKIKRMVAAAAPTAGGYMRVWIDREQEIAADLEARAAEQRDAEGEAAIAVNTTLRVLTAARATLPGDSQRMSQTQARIAEGLGIKPNLISLAFRELRAVGAVLHRQRKGKSITWEIDAEYASRLNDDERAKAIAAQQQQLEREAMDAKKQAQLDAIAHRVVPWPNQQHSDNALIYDDRQPPLIDAD